MMNVSGLFDTEWRFKKYLYIYISNYYLFIYIKNIFRVIVACRDGRVYNIKEGDVRGTAVLTGNIIDAGSQIVCIARQDKVILFF